MTEIARKPRGWPRRLAVAAVLLALLVVGAAMALDGFLTSAARKEAARLSGEWGRPVEIGGVRTTFLTGLGVRVEGIRVGAEAGESKPLLELDRAEVKLELLRALRSGGRDVRIRTAELQGLRVALVKRRDGTTNAERLAAAMERRGAPAAATPAPAPAGTGTPADLSGVRVEHAGVLDARIALVDDAAGGKELFVEDLDLVVDGLAAGAPFELVLKAGVLQAAQNLELRVRAPPLPATLVPSPDRVTLKVKPVDLTPLAAFAPREAGFRGGRFTADLEVALGAAVPGGTGPTTLRGGFAATALRFAGQEGGRALDVTLDADVAADAAKGDLSIAKLLLAFGPAALEGRGKVSGLLSDQPRIEGLRVSARNLDLAALAPHYPPLPRLLGGTVAGPIGLAIEAAGTAERPAVELRVDLTPVRLAFPRQLEKGAGGKLTFVARVRGAAAGALRLEAEGDLGGVDLRPGGALAKKPGDRMTFAIAASRRAEGASQKLELGSLVASLLDTTVRARGTAEVGPRSTRFDLAAEVDRVDVDRLLAPAKAEKAGATTPAPAPGGGAADFSGLAGRATLRVGEVLASRQRLSDVRVTVAVKEDEVTVEEGRLSLWDGTFSVAGTTARLGPPNRPFRLAAKVEHAEVGGVLAAFTDKRVLTGRLDADVQLAGEGESTDAILKALDGTVEGRLTDATFHGKDLVAEVLGPIADAIPALKGKVTKGGATRLGKVLPVSLRFKDGRAQLQRPLTVEERGVTLEVQGAFRVDGELEMPTRVLLSPGALADLTGGRAKVDGPVPLGCTLSGKAWSPRLSGLDVGPAVKAVGAKLGEAAVGKALGLDAPPREAAKEKAAEVKEQAKAKADDAAKKLKDDAAKRLRKLF